MITVYPRPKNISHMKRILPPPHHSPVSTLVFHQLAGWCSWLSRMLHTHKVLGSSPSLVIFFFPSLFCLP
ncbi:hypothetical protein BO71DRAFT_110229 [Aspergillus ellipticus CBS 707.79]|uniref:Uncharacterized protein n=1 Tax=Aspergillus ellipticus CBS 707.79 TaxID=1448320 RepID=A0A319CVN3_9EURO|nr:hypothetical protein BO71DRAFT_110229 [Aspergillus ellipticus CBS 707.79]